MVVKEHLHRSPGKCDEVGTPFNGEKRVPGSRIKTEKSPNRLSPKNQVPPRSPIMTIPPGLVRSHSYKGLSSVSPTNTLAINTNLKVLQQSPQQLGQQLRPHFSHQHFSPLSADSSSSSSRKASVSAFSASKTVSPTSKPRSNSVSSNFKITSDSLHNAHTPTLVLPPNLASLNSQSTLSMTHMGSNPVLNTAAMNGSGSVIITNVTEASSNSSKSANNSATSSLRSSYKPIKRQYILNEQLYLARMKNSHLDEYYTRGIAPAINEDEDEDTDLDIDNDDIEFNSNSLNGNERKYIQPYENELFTMSTKHLTEKMGWLRESDPDNPDIESVIKFLENNCTQRNPAPAQDPQFCRQESELIVNKLSKNPLVQERLEWQTMLSNVLRGDIVKSEKTKLAKQRMTNESTRQCSDDIWLELKSWLCGRTIEEQRTWFQYLRASTDEVFQKILDFRLEDDTDTKTAFDNIEQLLGAYYKVVPYWKHRQQMHQEKPITNTDEFNFRLETMNSYVVLYTAFNTEIAALKRWIGNDDLDIKVACNTTGFEGVYKNDRSFAEQILKEKDIENIFQRKIFYRHAPWILKAKCMHIEYAKNVVAMNLPSLQELLTTLLTFPLKLIKEIIHIRINYAKKLKQPTMMMIDQMIDDFRVYIKLAVQIKYTVSLYCNNHIIESSSIIDSGFDKTVNEAIRYFFRLLNLKLVDSSKKSFKTFKEPEVLFVHWEDLKNVGCYIDGANEVVSVGFVNLTLRLLNRLHSYVLTEHNDITKLNTKAECEKWIAVALEHIGSFKRKMNRFSNVLTKALKNSANYRINDSEMLFKNLKESGHFLIYTGGHLEDDSVYLFGSPELLGYSGESILHILNGTEVGSDLIPRVSIKNSLSVYTAVEQGISSDMMLVQEYRPDGVSFYHIQSDNPRKLYLRNRNRSPNAYDTDEEEGELYELELKLKSLGYLLAICPGEAVLWEGEMYNLSSEKELTKDDFHINVAPNTLTLFNQGSTYSMDYLCDRFEHSASDSVMFVDRRCSIRYADATLQKINKAYFRITYHTLLNYCKVVDSIKSKFRGIDSLNSVFIFCRDFARNFLRSNVAPYEKKSIIIMMLLKISIQWLTFLVDDCDPNDAKTFRWCVPAVEFAMQMTSGWNILGINKEQFKNLKDKISSCMALLISHFDIMGVRSWEAEKTVLPQMRPNIDIEVADEDVVSEFNSKMRLEAIKELEGRITKRRPIGKVLDATDKENQYLLSLASSLYNVSIRWQKRSFIGGGSFGSVYSAVNLDTGDILAVKEIRFHDRKSMRQVFPSIKDEMTVLEMLNHPNIVQYYGVEVHRDRVNIFMEYCEGGSLASLLEHGRIEDEMVTQVYSLQLLEGLAYLHESGVHHRDIKPENILLDFNGIIKYVDFGAAKLIATNGSKVLTEDNGRDSTDKMIGTPMYMSPESISASGYGKFGSDDIWSLGCVVLEMVTGRRPWANLDNQWAIMYQVAAGQIPSFPTKHEMSPTGIKFLSRCLIQDPNMRSSAVELLMDPWIVEIRNIAFGEDVNEEIFRERDDTKASTL
ncbi:mitogen-activated protein kinase kinase kinase SSK2 Ecym_2499 [Eremothecium cymbalariae DBVPG|uniref:MAP kinase kinase kinase n=1 Tax=Eremothecium cymbalariae (strain CBS 270.75 / DBVPG 7215 / KCTC 17166 / NRRL Y-17582) TaxID=931890 RepID=G8JPW3_ERECY|nr:Hypothetical protein Ecym_2499 [Eremothecium cymbalariae DBVPG\